MQSKTNYLTKKDILRKVHESKKSHNYYLEDRYSDHHCIVQLRDEITPELIQTIVASLARPKGKTPAQIVASEDVHPRHDVRAHSARPQPETKARDTDQPYARTPFPPFKHFVLKNGEIKEVGRSHWDGGFQNGSFCFDKRRINDRLARMFVLLVDRIATRSNWRTYSYLDEMRGNAVIQLCASGLLFDESKSDNPFAWGTTLVNHAFARVLNIEKKRQLIRDNLLEMHGALPSNTRMIDHELRDMHVPEPISARNHRIEVNLIQVFAGIFQRTLELTHKRSNLRRIDQAQFGKPSWKTQKLLHQTIRGWSRKSSPPT